MSHFNRDYVTRIRRMGGRMTAQRRIILDTVCRQGGHLTAGEIYELVQAEAPEINRATVYRALDFFSDMNLVARTEIGGRCLYEIVDETPHHHLVCRHCGKSERLEDHHFEELAEHLRQEHNFHAELNHVVISGYCTECVPESGVVNTTFDFAQDRLTKYENPEAGY